MRWLIAGLAAAALSLFPAAVRAEPLVGAFYYPWYVPSNPAHDWTYTLRDNLVPAQQPSAGYYNSQDESVISQQIAAARQGNISFWASSWWGPNSTEDLTLKNYVLTNPNASELKYAIHYESAGRLGSISSPNYTNLLPDFEYIAQSYFNNPNYLTVNGRPVVFIYITRAYFNGTSGAHEVASLRSDLERKFGVNPYLIGDDIYPGNNNQSRASLWDAITDEDVYGSVLQQYGSTHTAVTQLKSQYQAAESLAHAAGNGFIPTVEPGFNDTGVRTGHTPAPRYETDVPGSSEGSLFSDELTNAVLPTVDSNANNIVLVNSFNEWHEDTSVEPIATAAATSTANGVNNGYGTPSTGGYSYTGYGNLYLNELAAATHTSQSGWMGASGGLFSNSANWNSGVAPGLNPFFATTDTATFGNSAGSMTVDLVNSSPSLNSLVFNNAGSTSIVASGSGGITLAGASATITAAGTQSIAAPLTMAANVTVNVIGNSDSLTISGVISGNYQLAKLGAGTLSLTGPQSFGAGTALSVGGTGTVRINAGAAGSVAAGAVVTVASSATLELDGGVSALVDPTANFVSGPNSYPSLRAAVKNDGTLSVVSTAANQVQEVGGVDPNSGAGGSVVVNDNARLIADHIIQSSLVIGSGATFTLAPSAADGSPMAGFALAGSLTTSGGFVDASGSLLTAASSDSRAAVSFDGSAAPTAVVPEPSALVLLALACVLPAGRALVRRR
jgi:autotransporter-associated beta strand protein